MITMTRRLFLTVLTVTLALSALLAGSSAASAAQLELVGGSTAGGQSLDPYQLWADDSYAPTYPGEVQLTLSPGPLTCGTATSAVGCTDWSRWPLPGVQIDTGDGAYQAHQYLMHELGHVFDATEMQDQFRAEFMTIWGLPGGVRGWWTPFGTDHRSAGEWFAESYRLCAAYGAQMPYQTWLTDSPSYGFPGDRATAKQDASCRLILQAGAAAGLPAPASPTVYRPRVSVQASRKVAECRGDDLLLPGKPVRCETMSGGSRSRPWIVLLQTRPLRRTELHGVRLAAVRGRPAFALVRR